MKTRIFYFSGTGNSLLTAGQLAERLENSTAYPLAKLGDARFTQEDAVGFIFPVYFLDVPAIVLQHCATPSLQNAGYLFCVATCGGKAGNALPNFRNRLRSAGAKMDYGAVVKLPDNSIIYRTSPEEREQKFKALGPELEIIAREVSHRNQNADRLRPSRMDTAQSWVLRFGMKHFLRYEDKRVAGEKCTQCGLCARICPAGNISVENGEICFGKHCTDCFRCIQWCPAQAIRFGKLTVDAAGQYRCPGIKAGDLAADTFPGHRQ